MASKTSRREAEWSLTGEFSPAFIMLFAGSCLADIGSSLLFGLGGGLLVGGVLVALYGAAKAIAIAIVVGAEKIAVVAVSEEA